MNKGVIILIYSLLLISCLSPTPYQSKSSAVGGYTIFKISDSVYRIVFQGNQDTGRQRAVDYAMLKSAEEALSKGHEYFVVIISRVTNIYLSDTISINTKPAIRIIDSDGTVSYTNNYFTNFNRSREKYPIAMPLVNNVIEFVDDNYEEDEDTYEAKDIIAHMSKKYNLKL